MISGLLHEAWISIGVSRLRTFLAVLGIVIGVASVVTMIAVGTGSREAVEESIRKLGSNLLIVTPGARSVGGLRNTDFSPLTVKDAEAISQLPSVLAASPTTASQQFQVQAGKANWNTRVTGVSPEFFAIRQWQFTAGGEFSADDVRLGKRVAIVGSTIVDKLFEGEDAVGAVIRINNMPFTIIGVLAAKGQDYSGRSQDDIVYLPITTAQGKLLGNNYLMGIVQAIYVQARSQDAMISATAEISTLLRERHRLRENASDDFTVHNLTSITQTASDTSRALSMLLGAIASISLIVGGIGVMNIMLVTVAERTREIGIRKAIGASRQHILLQFLLEAVLITASGSLLGLMLGVAGAASAEHWFAIPTAYSLWSVALAVAVAIGVGILSGLYPAYKAARLEPIEALRIVGA